MQNRGVRIRVVVTSPALCPTQRDKGGNIVLVGGMGEPSHREGVEIAYRDVVADDAEASAHFFDPF